MNNYKGIEWFSHRKIKNYLGSLNLNGQIIDFYTGGKVIDNMIDGRYVPHIRHFRHAVTVVNIKDVDQLTDVSEINKLCHEWTENYQTELNTLSEQERSIFFKRANKVIMPSDFRRALDGLPVKRHLVNDLRNMVNRYYGR